MCIYCYLLRNTSICITKRQISSLYDLETTENLFLSNHFAPIRFHISLICLFVGGISNKQRTNANFVECTDYRRRLT